MGKKKMKIFKTCILICVLILTMNSCNKSFYSHTQNKVNSERNNIISNQPVMNENMSFAKDDRIAFLTEEGKTAFDQQKDIIIKIQGKEFLIRLNYVGSGFVYVLIVIYYKEGNEWKFQEKYMTNTCEIFVELNEEEREIIFKSNSRKKYMSLSFDALLIDYDCQ